MEQRLTFTWDADRGRLHREPDSPVCTREENMIGAARIQAIQGDDPVARETARYEMAKEAYDLRDWYQPCTQIPGGPMPRFMDQPDNSTYQDIRAGLGLLSRSSNAVDIARYKEKYPEAERAARFAEYVQRVATVEGYNQTCCMTLLMSHAWLKELNPEGDAAAIELLRELLRGWFRIAEPATETSDRHAQAKHHARDFRWLTSGWRTLWESP